MNCFSDLMQQLGGRRGGEEWRGEHEGGERK